MKHESRFSEVQSFTGRPRFCLNCRVNTKATLYTQFTQSGPSRFVWKCSRCERSNPFGVGQLFVPEKVVERHLTDGQIALLPLIMPDAPVGCRLCGNRKAAPRHRAHRAVFGKDECEQQLKDYLCETCHVVWRDIVTTQLVNN